MNAANEISETYYAAKFNGQEGRRLFEHVIDVLLKIEFIDLSYMVEEHIPLTAPENYPIYVINQFPDLNSNRWNLKTLLSNQTSFKIDIPEIEAQSIPEMNHFYFSWNIYAVPSIQNDKNKYQRTPMPKD